MQNETLADLKTLSEKATQGEVTASDWSTDIRIGRYTVGMANPQGDGNGLNDRAFIMALWNAYRDGSLIHRSALAEDTARAVEGWEPIETAPKDGTKVLLWFAPPFHDTMEDGIATGLWSGMGWWLSSIWASTGAHRDPTHWRPLPATPALPLDKEAADANR